MIQNNKPKIKKKRKTNGTISLQSYLYYNLFQSIQVYIENTLHSVYDTCCLCSWLDKECHSYYRRHWHYYNLYQTVLKHTKKNGVGDPFLWVRRIWFDLFAYISFKAHFSISLHFADIFHSLMLFKKIII